MAWSGGTYSKGNNVSGGWVGDASVGIGIEAGRHDTQDNDFATGINTCIAKDGQNAATADLPMATFKHTNIGNATARNQYGAVGQVQDGDFIWLGTTGGTTTVMTASATPPITAYKAGQKFRMLTGTASTGSNATGHTLAINGLAPKAIRTGQGLREPTIGDWISGGLLELVYDGTVFRIDNAAGEWATWSPTLSVAGGATTGVSFSVAIYQKYSRICHVQCVCAWTQTVVPSSYIAITLPIVAFYNNESLTATGFVGANIAGGIGFTATGGTVVNIYNYNIGSFSLGSNQVFFGGTYMTA